MRIPRILAGLLAVAGCLLPAPAGAGETKLVPVPPQALAGLGPWLARGDLLLFESKADGTLAQVTLISRVAAPAATVLEVLAHPEGFPSLVKTMKRSEVSNRQGKELDVAWEIEIPFKNPSGVMHYVDDRPKEIRYWPRSGSVPDGAWRWEALPIDAGSCLLVHQNYAQTREISWAVAKFLDAWPTFEHGAVASTMIVFFKAVVARSEELASGRRAPSPTYVPGRRSELTTLAGGRTPLGLAPLAPLLARGMVGLLEYSAPGQLRQATLIQKVRGELPKVRALVANPADYPKFIPSIETVEMLQDAPDRAEFRMWMEMPLIKLTMQQQMVRGASRIALRTVGGDLPSSVAAWDLFAGAAPQETIATYYSYSDPGEIAWFVRKLLVKEPYFAPGLNLATGMVLVRAVADRMAGRNSRD